MNPFDTAHAMARALGHEMSQWTIHEHESGFAVCVKCGAMLCVAEGWDIFGSATKTHCHEAAKHKYRLKQVSLKKLTVGQCRLFEGDHRMILVGPPDDCRTISGTDVELLIEGMRKLGWA